MIWKASIADGYIGRKHESHSSDAIGQFFKYGDIVWPIKICAEKINMDKKLNFNTAERRTKRARKKNQLKLKLQGVNAYFCHKAHVMHRAIYISLKAVLRRGFLRREMGMSAKTSLTRNSAISSLRSLF